MVPQTIVLPLNDSHPFIHFSALGGGVLYGLLFVSVPSAGIEPASRA